MAKMTLKASRVNVDLTQKEVAQKIGVDHKTIWNWEKGITFPNPIQIQALCSLYGVSYDDIIFLKTNSD